MISWFIETKSDIQTQRNYTTKQAKQAPARQSIINWHKQFKETGTLLHKPRSGMSRTSEEERHLNPLDWKMWANSLAPSFSGYNILEFFLVGLRERCCVPHQSKGHK